MQHGTAALNGVSFEAKRGEIFYLLGQNGAGPTTIINLFLGFIEVSGGKALINDVEVKQNHRYQQNDCLHTGGSVVVR